MADIKQITIPGNNTPYNIKDASAVANVTKSGTSLIISKRDGTSTTLENVGGGTEYSAGDGIDLTGDTITNTGVRSVTTGTTNGTIKVDTNGTSADVAVKGLGSLAYKNSLSASDVGALNSSLKGANSGVAELDSSGKIPSSQLPSYVDDVLEYSALTSFPATGETGKIYVDTTTNKTYRWSGSAYVEISASLALGETSSTAYRGDYGAAAYAHAVTNKGSAFTSGLYKITTNSEGHIISATPVSKDDITALGIPGSDTNDNTTYTFTNGTNGFTVTPSGGSAQTVTITPSISNNVTGSGTSGYLAKFNGANTVTSGPQLGSSTTTFLRNDGTWATPSGGDVVISSTQPSSGKIWIKP